MGWFREIGNELLRRKVIRLLGAYIAVFWLLAVGLASLFPALGVPAWVFRTVVVLGIAAIPVLAFFSWKYDIVPPHLVRDIKDLEGKNPALGWARVRHDAREAGYVLLAWGEPGGAAKERRFFEPIAIGRAPNNDVELADERVSRHHAVIWAEDGAWRVRDLGSANGTFIGFERVHGTAVLPESCDLRLHRNGPVVAVRVTKSLETRVG